MTGETTKPSEISRGGTTIKKPDGVSRTGPAVPWKVLEQRPTSCSTATPGPPDFSIARKTRFGTRTGMRNILTRRRRMNKRMQTRRYRRYTRRWRRIKKRSKALNNGEKCTLQKKCKVLRWKDLN